MSDNKSRVKVIAVASHKGGVGKTTTVAQIGAGFSLATIGIGKVVLVDTDPQGHLGDYLGIGSDDDFAAAFLGQQSIENSLVNVPHFSHLWALRGGARTWDDVERLFVRQEPGDTTENLAMRLRSMLDMLQGLVEKGEEVIGIIDTAPSFSEMQTAALLVADYIICPFTPDFGGEKGMLSTWRWFETITTATGNHQKEFGVLPQQYDLQNPQQARDLRRVQLTIGTSRVLPAIPHSEEIGDLIDNGRTIWTSKKMENSEVNIQYAGAMSEIASALGLELRSELLKKKSSNTKGKREKK